MKINRNILLRFLDNLLQADESGRRYRQLKDVEFNDNNPNDISELMNVLPNIDLTDVMEIPKGQINFYYCNGYIITWILHQFFIFSYEVKLAAD